MLVVVARGRLKVEHVHVARDTGAKHALQNVKLLSSHRQQGPPWTDDLPKPERSALPGVGGLIGQHLNSSMVDPTLIPTGSGG
jgi:hypothetical protein